MAKIAGPFKIWPFTLLNKFLGKEDESMPTKEEVFIQNLQETVAYVFNNKYYGQAKFQVANFTKDWMDFSVSVYIDDTKITTYSGVAGPTQSTDVIFGFEIPQSILDQCIAGRNEFVLSVDDQTTRLFIDY